MKAYLVKFPTLHDDLGTAAKGFNTYLLAASPDHARERAAMLIAREWPTIFAFCSARGVDMQNALIVKEAPANLSEEQWRSVEELTGFQRLELFQARAQAREYATWAVVGWLLVLLAAAYIYYAPMGQ